MANKVYNMEGGLHSAAAFSSFENAMYGACVANASSYTISAGSGMNVVLSTGDALIPTGTGFARRIHSDSTNTVSISTASTSYARKDAIVAYIDGSVSPTTTVVDNTNGILKFKSVAGSPSANPVAPSASAIQSSVGAGNPYIVLWYVTVPKSASAMTSATFEDNRNIASKVKSENIANGAVTEDKMQKNIITVRMNDASDVLYNSATDLPLTITESKIGTKLTLSSNTITIGSGVSHIKVSASIYGSSSGSRNYVWGGISVNGTVLDKYGFISNIATGNYGSAVCSPIVMAVSQGDRIKLRLKEGGLYILGKNTWITVEVID